uniref:Putative secreted protein n=1 Tax=Amblyomma cajennense TaxID=34607 RepID=A0A023FBX0_AMBCJ
MTAVSFFFLVILFPTPSRTCSERDCCQITHAITPSCRIPPKVPWFMQFTELADAFYVNLLTAVYKVRREGKEDESPRNCCAQSGSLFRAEPSMHKGAQSLRGLKGTTETATPHALNWPF